ncbi:MAG: DUF998 domain-containing protein [Acidimicrobiales bacterium]
MAPRTRPLVAHPRLAWGGIVGPATFVAAWLVSGAMRPGYSPVADGISQLAAVGASTRPLMTAGFVVFGVGVPAYAVALHRSVPGSAYLTSIATGLAVLGVAAFPLGRSSTTDVVHGGWAMIGYVTLAATPLLAALPLAASGHHRAATASVATGVASGLCLAATLVGPGHGLLQRVGLTLGDTWLVVSAAWMLSGGHATG